MEKNLNFLDDEANKKECCDNILTQEDVKSNSCSDDRSEKYDEVEDVPIDFDMQRNKFASKRNSADSNMFIKKDIW